MAYILEKEELPNYTYEEYKLWKGKWEIIDGVPFSMLPAPSVLHQEINLAIASQFNRLAKECGKCKAMIPVDWKINETTVVQPDVSVVCRKPKNNNYLDFAPEIIFEILSPATKSKDRVTKFELYQNEGVKYYVIVDPVKKTAEVFELSSKKSYQKKSESGKGKFVFTTGGCEVSFDFSEIWG